VTVEYIFLGDMLAENGEDILEELSDERFLDLMSLPLIKYIVIH
jgi:hypothetical protein